MGIWSLLPPAIIIIIAIKTRSSLIPLLIGCTLGYMMLAWFNPPGTGSSLFTTTKVDTLTTIENIKEESYYSESLSSAELFGLAEKNTPDAVATVAFPDNMITGLYDVVMKDEALVWVLYVCALFGPFIGLLIASGGIAAIGKKAVKNLKTKKQSLLLSYFLGFIFFVDDYLSTLGTGATMKKITDHFKIPREMLGYIIGAVSVPLTVIVPISTWTVYIGGLMKDSGIGGEDASAIDVFVGTIPYNIYAWVAMVVALLVVLGLFPTFKRMKLAMKRAEETGVTVAPDSENLQSESVDLYESTQSNGGKGASINSFLLPMLSLIVFTLLNDNDLLKGIIYALGFTFFYYWIGKIVSMKKYIQLFEDGFKSMTFVLVVLVVTYLLKRVSDDMGLTTYVVDIIKDNVTPQLLPAMIFLLIGAITVATGSSWGVYAVVTMIVAEYCNQTGANVMLNMGALISAGIWGANACFYSDSRILTAGATQSNMTEQSLTQLPYVIIVTVVTTIIYLVLGYTM